MPQVKFIKHLPFFCLILFLIFYGCSNQYVEKEFKSKKDYHSHFNKEIKDRNANINFINGKSVSSNYVRIKGDSVYRKIIIPEKRKSSVSVSTIKKIDYQKNISLNPVIFNGSIKLKNDSVIYVDDAEFLKGKLSYYGSHPRILSKSLNDVESISYNNHLKGMLEYGFAGMITGGVIGYEQGSNAGPREDVSVDILTGSFVLGLGGMIAGVIIGSPQNYVINENKSETEKFLDKFGILGGITSSTLYGGFSDNRNYTTEAKEQYTFGLYYSTKINSFLKFRPELIYCVKGGSYKYYKNSIKLNYSEDFISTLYLKTFEVPILIQLGPSSPGKKFPYIFAGPALNFPIKGEIDENIDVGQDNIQPYSVETANTKPYLSFIFGIGNKWDRHISTEILFDEGITSLGNAVFSDGSKLKLMQRNILLNAIYAL